MPHTDRARRRPATFARVLRFAFAHLGRQPWRTAATAGAVTLFTLSDMLVPVVSGVLIDAVAGPADPQAQRTTVLAFAALMALALTGVLFRHAAFMLIIRLTLQIMHEVAAEAFQRVQRFSTDWHANNFAGSTQRRITRGLWAFDLLNDTVLTALLSAALMLVGITVLIGVRFPWIGVAVAATTLVYLGMTAWFTLRVVAPAASLSNSWDTRLGGALADSVSCNTVVKAFGAETREEAALERVLSKWEARTGRTWRRGTWSGTAQGGLLWLLRGLVIGAALLAWVAGDAGPGDVAFVLTALVMLQGYLRDMGQHIGNLQRSINDLEELVDLHDAPLGVEDRPGAGPIAVTRGRVAFEAVDFHYGAHETPLFADLSVTIEGGERVGLVGRSGSGKTTFVKLIQRLYDVTGGRITIDGQDIAAVRQGSLRSQVAIVQQEPVLFHRSLADNIAYGRPGATQAEIEEAARQASAHDFIARLPKGYGTLVGERGVKLSGGERQRVAIARAFLADARVLILDEATSSLDAESEREIQEAMGRLMEGRTTIVIAHRLSTVRDLDRLLVFDRGRLAEQGPHEVLMRRTGGLYRRLVERQSGLMPDRAEAEAGAA